MYGASLDDVASLAKFAKDQELEFSLLSDPDGSAATRYGVLSGKARWASRVTFVIDEQGVLRAIEDGVKVRTHGEDLVKLIERLKG